MNKLSCYTTTSSGSAASPKTSLSVAFPFSPPDQTIGAESRSEFVSLGQSNQLTSEAWVTLVNTPDRRLAANAETLLEDIESAIERLGLSGYDVRILPRLHAFAPEDSSLIFEWTAPKFRVGFSVERNPSDSGWYLVSTPDLGQFGASGQLSGSEPRSLIPSLLHFVARNS